MSFFDLSHEELKIYRPERNEPADFDAFWAATLADSRKFALNARFEKVDVGLALQDVFDVSFAGFEGQQVKGWLLVPKGAKEPLPCVVNYIGYGGGRSLSLDWLLWSSVGYAHFVMDTRGQGSSWSSGDTPDVEMGSVNGQYPGFMTRGVLDPKTYYYRRVFVDGVRAVEAALASGKVDAGRVAVTGASQGGGITLAVAGLSDAVQVAMPDVPFLCHYRRAVEVTDTFPYQEIRVFCKTQRLAAERVFETLAYFDGVNFATRAKAKALFSVGLMDDICPPSTVYAAYNYYAGEKEMQVWEFNNHEGGEVFQKQRQVDFLKGIFG